MGTSLITNDNQQVMVRILFTFWKWKINANTLRFFIFPCLPRAIMALVLNKRRGLE